MKRKFADLMRRNVVAEVTVMKCVQACCFLTAMLVFAYGLWNLAHLDLTAAQILLGIAWTTFLPMLLAGSALLLPLAARREDEAG